MGIVALFGSAAGLIGSIHNLGCQALLHGSLRTLTRIESDPAQTQGLAPFRTNLKRYLVGRTAYTASLNLQYGHNILHGSFKSFQGIITRLFFDDVESVVHDLLCDTFFTIVHNVVDQACNKLRVVQRIRQNVTLSDLASSWHLRFPPSLSLMSS